ncbi:MAG: Rpp14/Pop5 family protein [Candidatus Heimdallarchaeota archaeon]
MKTERTRYIIFEILSSYEITFRELIYTIWREISALFGESGSSKTGLWLTALKNITLEEETNLMKELSKLHIYRGSLRTNHQSTNIIRTALAFISDINGKPACFSVLRISGTMKTVQKKYLAGNSIQ